MTTGWTCEKCGIELTMKHSIIGGRCISCASPTFPFQRPDTEFLKDHEAEYNLEEDGRPHRGKK